MQKKLSENEVDDISDEVVDDVDDDIKRLPPSATDVTFGSIHPMRNSLSHFSVDSNAIAVVNNLKRQWKLAEEKSQPTQSAK